MKAITIKEPWASMISHGFKTMETRSWPTSYRGPIAIHAGRGEPDKEWMENVPEMMDAIDDDIHPGCIVAYANIVDCKLITDDVIKDVKKNPLEYISGFYKNGRYAFVFDNICPVEPIAVKGKQKIWNFKSEDDMYLLAIKIDDFADSWDPYEYNNAFNTRTEGIENFMTDLANGGEGIMDWLSTIIDEEETGDPDYDELIYRAKKLIKEVEEWLRKA